jgi:plasmid maintenance system antidote protein VapI
MSSTAKTPTNRRDHSAGGCLTKHALSNLINGRSGVSPEMAIRLEKVFGGDAETWLRLQLNFDIWHARKNADRIRVERLVPA